MSTGDARFSSHAECLDALEDIPTNPDLHDTLADVVNRRLNRREAIGRMIGIGALAVSPQAAFAGKPQSGAAPTSTHGFDFEEIAHGVDRTHHVSPATAPTSLTRWGDPVTAGAPDFDPYPQSADGSTAAVRLQQRLCRLYPPALRLRTTPSTACCASITSTRMREMMFPESG